MRDYLRSIARTVLPAAWGAVVAWLVSRGLVPDGMTSELQHGLVAATTPVAIGVVYALVRWVEPHMPAWLTRLALGSNQPPIYVPAEARQHRS